MVESIPLALLFGLIYTLNIHLAQSMEKHGIEIFSRKKKMSEKGKKPLIYIVGLVINNTVFLYQMIGALFAEASVFTSVYGVGNLEDSICI